MSSVDARDRMERLEAAVEYLGRTFDLQGVTTPDQGLDRI